MDELIELDNETESDEAPEETKTTFWGQATEFLTMLAFGASI
jgi:hypothetical protein